MNKAEIVAAHIRAHKAFTLVEAQERYHHMGATLADAVLQRGIDYNTVVEPRIKRLVAKYPDAATTSAFARLVREHGAAQVLEWSDGQKPQTLVALINLLLDNGLETEDDLRAWLETSENVARLQLLKGVKEKTAHYLQILLGIQTVAVDMHLFDFLSEAGVPTSNYTEAHQILRETAELLGIEASKLDYSIWLYGSTTARKSRSAKLCTDA